MRINLIVINIKGFYALSTGHLTSHGTSNSRAESDNWRNSAVHPTKAFLWKTRTDCVSQSRISIRCRAEASHPLPL